MKMSQLSRFVKVFEFYYLIQALTYEYKIINKESYCITVFNDISPLVNNLLYSTHLTKNNQLFAFVLYDFSFPVQLILRLLPSVLVAQQCQLSFSSINNSSTYQ